MSGRLDGTAKYYYTSGAVETRIYENGVLQGKAVKQSSAGEVEERSYTDGKLNGKATVLYTDSSKEMRTYKDNKLTGPASLFSASGERIEFEYCDGVVHGPAKIKVRTSLEDPGVRLLLTFIRSCRLCTSLSSCRSFCLCWTCMNMTFLTCFVKALVHFFEAIVTYGWTYTYTHCSLV